MPLELSWTINHNYTLVIDKENGKFIKRQIPLNNNYSSLLEKYQSISTDETISFDNFLKTIESEEIWETKLRDSYYHVVGNFSDSWNNIKPYSRNIIAEILNHNPASLYEDKYQQSVKESFLSHIKIRIRAQNLKDFYEESEKLISAGTRILYSHSREGWHFPEHKFNEVFSAGLETNFGYGRSSFFFAILKYKGLTIIPYMDLVSYQIADAFYLARFTRRFDAYCGLWQEAIDFCLDSFNLAIDNEQGFIQKYVVDEAIGLIERLEQIFTNSEFTFKKYDGSYYKETYTGPQLIAFRIERMSHALSYIESIIAFEKALNLDFKVGKILQMNQKIYSIIDSEIEIYTKEHEKAKEETIEAKNVFDSAARKEREESEYHKRFRCDFEEKFSENLYSLLYSEQHRNTRNELWKEKNHKDSIFRDFESKSNYIYKSLVEMAKGKERIEKYFEEHSLELELI